MNLSSLIQTGIINRPQRIIVYGPKSIGKTKLVANLENALLIDTEASSHQYNCDRINIGNYEQLNTAITTLLTEPNRYRFIAVDTADWADEYIRAEVCREKGVSDIGEFAHGRGYVLWRDKFIEFLLKLNGFIRLGINVILLGHSQIRTVTFPGLDPYDRYELKLDKRNVETLTEWADAQLFANWDVRTSKSKDGTVRARGGNDRYIYSVNDLGYDAKNRLGITEPLRLEPASLMRFLSSVAVPASRALAARPGVGARAGGAMSAATPGVTTGVTASASDSKTSLATEVPNPDEVAVEPFLTKGELQTAQTILADLPQDNLLRFLRTRDLIKPDGDYTELGPTFLRRVLADPAGFREAVTGA